MEIPQTPGTESGKERPVPTRALVLSVLALAVPVAVNLAFPALAEEEYGILVWLSALVPPFLLTYYRSWVGASAALAAGMAAISLTHAGLSFANTGPPPTPVLLGLISVLIAVSLGAGWLSELLGRARREAEEMALTDGLTGLANRRHLGVFLDTAFAAGVRGTPLAVVLFDIDNFKAINDRHGHATGDRVLQAFGQILRERTRNMNLTGRWGGEEFLSVLSGTDAEGARLFAEDVRRRLADTDLPCGQVTVSAGVAGFEASMSTPEILVAAADQALYRSKETGRNRVTVAPPGGSRKDAAPEAPTPPAATDDGREETGGREPPRRGTAGRTDDELVRGRGEVILVVDDDRDARRSVSRALSRFGYAVLQASGPEEALEIVRGREDPVDLLVSDVIMPTMSGFRLVEILLRNVPDLRVVYMSGYSQEGIDWEGAPGAATAFLSKPMSVEELARTARGVLDAPRRQTAAPAPHTPATRPPARATPSAATPVAGGAPPGSRILVIDDDPAVIRSLTSLLHRSGFESVEGTTDPADLPVLLARFGPDLVIVDMRMPHFDGLEVLAVLRELAVDGFLPIVALTGDDDPELRRLALTAGASDFMTKPVEDWELETRVRNLLRIRSMTRRMARHTQDLESRVAARTAELEEARTEILLRLAAAAEYRDDLTGHHAARVGILSGLLAQAVGVEPDVRDTIQRAAPLHDLGKIGVPDGILRKPGPLTDEEMDVMKRHTTIGAEILAGSRVPLLRMARDIAVGHHERWDGSGYPDGLVSDDIPLPSRIVAVADVFDSLSHDRPYRRALSVATTFEHLRRGAGTLYDPDLVDALFDLNDRGLVAEAQAVEIIAGPDDSGAPGGTASGAAEREAGE